MVVRTGKAARQAAIGQPNRADGMTPRAYQLSLFDEPGNATQVAHIAGLVPSLKAAMQRTLLAVNPPLAREQLVYRMNGLAKLAGAKITPDKSRVLSLAVIEKWLAPNDRDHVPSLEALEVFMLAVDSREPHSIGFSCRPRLPSQRPFPPRK